MGKKRRAKGCAKAGGVIREVGVLGRKVEKALRDVVTSRHVADVQRETVRGVRGVGRKLAKALRAARTSRQGQDVKKQLRTVLPPGTKQSATASRGMRTNLAAGLRTLSRELARLAKMID